MFQTWYAWSPGGEGRSAILDHEGSYSFSAGNACGIWEHVVEVEVEDCECSIYVPSAFTPNNDGVNDAFAVEGVDPQGYRLEIYNRWGDLIFKSEDPKEVWQGNLQQGDGEFFVQDGVYLWRLRYEMRDGPRWAQGHVTLIR